MKKLLSIILCATMIFSALPVCAADVQLKFGAQVTGTDTPVFRELKTAENGKIAAMVTIPTEVFTAAGTDTAKLYVVKYDKNEVAAVAVTDVAASSAGERVTTAPIDALATDTLKAFVWNGTTLAPIGKLDGLPQKNTIQNYNFEALSSGTIVADGTYIANARLADVVADPEPNGTRGKVMKLLGNYNGQTDWNNTPTIKFADLKNTNDILGAWNAANRLSYGIRSVDYEFDYYVSDKFAYSDANGNDIKANSSYDFTLGDPAPIKFRLNAGDGTGRVQLYDMHANTYLAYDNSSRGSNLYNRWIPVKIEIRPYFESSVGTDGKVTETLNKDYCEIFFYFDGELIYHKLSSTYSNYATALTTWNGCEGRIDIGGSSQNWTHGRAVYIDNFRISM